MNYGMYSSVFEQMRREEERKRREREQQDELIKGNHKPAGMTIHPDQGGPPHVDQFNQGDPAHKMQHMPTEGPGGNWEQQITSGYDESLHKLDEEEAQNHSPRKRALDALTNALTVYAASKGGGNPGAVVADFVGRARAENDSIRLRREKLLQERQQTLNAEHARHEEMQYRVDAEERGYQHDDHMLGARQKNEKELLGIRAEIDATAQRQQHYDQLDTLQHEMDGRLHLSREEQAQRIEAMRLQTGLDVTKAAQITSIETAQSRAQTWEQLGADPVKARIVSLKLQSGDPLTDEERGFQGEMLRRTGEQMSREQARKDMQAIGGRQMQPVMQQGPGGPQPVMDKAGHPVARPLGAGEKLRLLDGHAQQLQQAHPSNDEQAVAALIQSGEHVSEAEIDAEPGLDNAAKSRLKQLLRSRSTAR